MAIDSGAGAQRALRLEQRATYLRQMILGDREFMAGVEEGYAQMQRGETITLAELDRELATWDAR